MEKKDKFFEELLVGIACWLNQIESENKVDLKAWHLSKEAVIKRYRNDKLFNIKVNSLASGIMALFEKYEGETNIIPQRDREIK